MTEELVTLETAKLLKDKGFNWKCEHLIDRNKVITKYNLPQSMSCCMEIDDESVEFLCPTLYIAQKWLREIRGVYVYVDNVMSKKKVYISLPITGYDIKDVEKRCKSASEFIEQLGFEAVSPLEVSSNPDTSYEEHIGRDITALLQCDAVLFLEGWHYSNGCSLEHSAAGIYEKERLFSIGELKRYAKEIGI